jgi:hypothetical protein
MPEAKGKEGTVRHCVPDSYSMLKIERVTCFLLDRVGTIPRVNVYEVGVFLLV